MAAMTVVVVVGKANQSVLTTIGSGLQGPRGPLSTTMGDWNLIYILGIAIRKLKVYVM